MSSGITNPSSPSPVTAGPVTAELSGLTGFPGIAGAPCLSVAGQADSGWEILAPAKLNLYLEVLGPRPDGFHALETLMVPVRVFDQLSWQENPFRTKRNPTVGRSLSLQVRNLIPGGHDFISSVDEEGPLGDLSNNLVLQAAKLLAQDAGITPYGCFNLIKRIPIQAGMGGGSSDAAATLMLANATWQLNYSREQLLPLAAELGSDVPFFLGTSAAICRGRGELIEPVTGLPRLHFVAVKPPVGLSTIEVFGQLRAIDETNNKANTKATHERAAASELRLAELISALQQGDLAVASCLMTNRLETAAERIAPWLVSLRKVFSQAGCLGHFMTGSGSTYVGVMRTATQAQSTARQLSSMNLGNVFATSSC